VAKSSANIFFNRSAKNDYVICADEKTSINDKHLTVKRQVGLDNHGSPPLTPTMSSGRHFGAGRTRQSPASGDHLSPSRRRTWTRPDP